MRLIFFILVVTFFSSNSLSAQIKIAGIILDSQTKLPLSFATIYNKAKNTGLYATEQGTFIISVQESDSIVFTCTGYQSLAIQVRKNNFQENLRDTFFLAPQIALLPEVTVTNISLKNLKSHKLGYSDFHSNAFVSETCGWQLAVYIPNKEPASVAYITKLLARYQAMDVQKKEFAVRFHLYASTENNTPGIELLDSNYFKIIKREKIYEEGITEADISSEKVQLPANGVFVGIEWLGWHDLHTNSMLNVRLVDPQIATNLHTKDIITWYKEPNGLWQVIDLKKYFINTPIYSKLISESNPLNASMGIVIKNKSLIP